MPYDEILRSELTNASLVIPPPIQTKLVRYCSELSRWNSKVNLTALAGAELVRRLVVEPIWIGKSLGMKGRLLDVGSGNGSPAIPLAVSRDLSETYLVESRTRRAAFLRHLKVQMGLETVRVCKCRLSELGREVEPLEWITLQGVALTDQIRLELRPFSKTTTNVVWITSGELSRQLNPSRRLDVPFSNTQVLVFSLDHS